MKMVLVIRMSLSHALCSLGLLSKGFSPDRGSLESLCRFGEQRRALKMLAKSGVMLLSEQQRASSSSQALAGVVDDRDEG